MDLKSLEYMYQQHSIVKNKYHFSPQNSCCYNIIILCSRCNKFFYSRRAPMKIM